MAGLRRGRGVACRVAWWGGAAGGCVCGGDVPVEALSTWSGVGHPGSVRNCDSTLLAWSWASSVRIPKFSLRWSKPVNAFQIVNMGLVYLLVPLRLYPEYLLFLGSFYLLFGLCWGMFYADEDHSEERSVS